MDLAQPTTATRGRTATGVAFDDTGSGPPIVLVHAGVADRRMWDDLAGRLAGRYRVIRHDVRGVGESLPPTGPWSHHGDLLALLDELLITQAHFVGASMGAGIAVEAALARPGLAASLLLVGPGGALFDGTPPTLRPIWAAEIEALDRGDLDGATEVNLRAWVDGPNRSPDAVDPSVRAFVGRMQREAFELPEWDAELAPEHELSPVAAGRIGELDCPVLVVVGDADDSAIQVVAQRVASSAPRGRLVTWPEVGHMLVLERPEPFARLTMDFIRAASSGEWDGSPTTAAPSTGPTDDAAPSTLRYVALGDSYTIGTALADPAERWPERLVRTLNGRRPLELVANLGVNGYTSRDVIEHELPALDELRPDFVSLLVGVNDVVQGVPPERFRRHATLILDELLARLPAGRIVTVATPDYTVTPAGSDYGDPATQSDGIRTNNATLRDLAEERGIAFVDTFDLSLQAGDDRSLVADDGLHPSGAQYALWVERIAPVVERLLGR